MASFVAVPLLLTPYTIWWCQASGMVQPGFTPRWRFNVATGTAPGTGRERELQLDDFTI